MTPERWQQIDRLFHSALDRESVERAAFLTQACNGDESLRHEVESLIRSHEQPESFIETPPSDIAAALLASSKVQLTAGELVGHYQIVSLLGEGGMGEVYLAQDLRLGRQVALKRLPAQFTLDAERVRRFEQEARAASALNHPSIITIHEIGWSESSQFITTEFIDGETLRQFMTRGRMNLDEALDIAGQVASALVAAHDASIAHRDIKPENIMVRRDGIVKVLDFGLAKLAAPSARSETNTKSRVQTNPGMVMGTVQYMSPEQARGEDVDTRTDIWSLGVVLYEMVAGRAPFDGKTPSHVIVSILESEPQPLLPGVEAPAELKRIISKSLRKAREGRYQTVNDLAVDLRSLKQAREVESQVMRRLESGTGGNNVSTAVSKSDGQIPVIADIGSQRSTFADRSAHTTPSAEYVVNKTKRHKLGAGLMTIAAIILFAMATYFYFSKGTRLPPESEAIDSVAVLPFVNITNDPNTEYLSDGISESIMNSLSRVPELRVMSRNSVLSYKGQQVDAQVVGKQLNVRAVLMGRLMQRGDDLTITIELVHVRDNRRLWGELYNRKQSDLLSIQAEISSEIAQALRLRLTQAEQQQLAQRETVNPKAYELLLRSHHFGDKGGTENQKKALEYTEQAIAVDPKYALAYARLAGLYSSLVNNNVFDQKEFLPKAEAAARKALELDQNLAEAHLAMADIKENAWDWAGAEREFKRAIELNPSLSRAHSGYTFFLMIQGRGEQALVEANRAKELDPISTGANAVVVYSLILTRHHVQALEAANRILELDQNNPFVHTLLGQTHGAMGQHREALSAFEEAIRLGDNSPDAQIMLGVAHAKVGQLERTREILKRLEKGKEYVSPLGFAILHVALGEREKALALLEQAYAAHDQQLIWLCIEGSGEGDFAPLASDPRFQDLMRRVGLKPNPA